MVSQFLDILIEPNVYNISFLSRVCLYVFLVLAHVILLMIFDIDKKCFGQRKQRSDKNGCVNLLYNKMVQLWGNKKKQKKFSNIHTPFWDVTVLTKVYKNFDPTILSKKSFI